MCRQTSVTQKTLHWDLHFLWWCLMSEVGLCSCAGMRLTSLRPPRGKCEYRHWEKTALLCLSCLLKLSLSYMRTEVVPWHLEFLK